MHVCLKCGMKSGSAQIEETKRIARISDLFIQEYEVWSGIYDQIEEGYHFLAGEQYSEQRKKYYEAKRRPTNVFNMIFPIFNQVLGDFFLSDERMKTYPKAGGDPMVADAIESILDTIFLNTDAKDELGSMLLAGMNRMGCAYPRYSDEREIDGSVVVGEVDEFEILFDHRAMKRFAEDAGYLMRSRWMTREQILRSWPHHKSKLAGILEHKDEYLNSLDVSEEMSRNWTHRYFTQQHQKDDQYRIIEYHEKVYEETEVALNTETGESEILKLKGPKLDLFLKLHPEMDVVERRVQVKKVTEIIPALNYHLDHKDAELQDGKWDYIVFFPYHYGKMTHRGFGLLQNAIGPQKHLNDMENTNLDILNKQANVGPNLKPSEIENYEQFIQSGQEPGFALEFIKTANIQDAFQQRKAPQIPTGHKELSEKALDFLFKVTNAHFNFMGGSQTANENASLFAQRVRQASKNLVVADFNFRACKRRIAEKAIKLVQQNIPVPKLMLYYDRAFVERTTPMQQFALADRILNDPILDEYKIGYDDLERNPTAKAVRFLEKLELTRLFAIELQLGPASIDYDWLLADSDVGDIDQLKAKIELVLGAQMQEAQQAEAQQVTNNILEMARKKQALEDEGGLSSPLRTGGGPAAVSRAVNG